MTTMKIFVVLTLVAVVRGTVVAPAIAVAEGGASAQFRSEDNLGNYNFGYNEDHTSGGTFRREAGDAHGNVAGSYGLRDADGRIRIVNYIANDDGFKADIRTNEPGVEPKDTADASFNKAESVLVQSAVAIPTVAEAQPVFPPYSAVAKTVVAQPVTYTFPEPAPVPVAKTHTTITTSETKPAVYTFPEPAVVPVAKTHTTVTETRPLPYAFPVPAAVPVAKSHTTVTSQVHPPAYTFPEVTVPVAKSIAAAPVAVASGPAYAFPAPAGVAKSFTSYSPVVAAPVAVAAPAATKVSYSSQYINTPVAVKTFAYAPRYAINPYLSHIRYATPYYNSIYSPAVASFAGSVPYFSNIEYHGYPVLKK